MADNLTKEQRSYCMSKVKGRDTTIEKLVRSHLHKRGLRFRKHAKALPGKPDIVFPKNRLVVFIDGDFWHGYRLPLWKDKLSEFWYRKIQGNRERDTRNHRKLRSRGWRVVRIWQHDIERDLGACIDKIVAMVTSKK